MSSAETLSRNDIVALTGVTHDVLTFWLRHELALPIGGRAGKGKHLRFPMHEANILALAAALRTCGANIEALKGIASIYRAAIAWAARVEVDHGDAIALAIMLGETMRRARAENLVPDDIHYSWETLINSNDHKVIVDSSMYSESSVARLKRVTGDFKDPNFYENLLAFVEIAGKPIEEGTAFPTFFWQGPAGWRRGMGPQGQDLASRDGAYATFAVDVLGLLARVWKPAEQAPDLEPAQ